MEVQQLQVQFHGGEYQLSMTATLSAPMGRVAAVLRDYASYPQLDSRIVTSQVVSRPAPNRVELMTRINVCFAFFCRKVDRVEQVEERPDGLLATVIPDRSDAKSGRTQTQLSASADGSHTTLVYSTQIVPKFWVPALLGRSLMLHSLRDATISLFEHIEQRAAVPSSVAGAT